MAVSEWHAEQLVKQNKEVIRLLRCLVVVTMQAPLIVKAIEEGSAPEVVMEIFQEQMFGIDGELKS